MNLQLVLHLLIRESFQIAKLTKRSEIQASESLRLDGHQIDPTPLDIEDLLFLANDTFHLQFGRGVTPTVQD